MSEIDLSLLAEPFPVGELSWRIVQSGKNDRGLWAKCAPYVDARAVMDRLDDVCGPGNWQTDAEITESHVKYVIEILVGDQWIRRSDGVGVAEPGGGMSASDAGKADFSYAIRRAGIQWAIGRYLYKVPRIWAIINDNGRFWQPENKKKGLPSFNWDPGALPAFALPGEPEIVGHVRELLEKAGSLGLGGEDDEETRGIEAAEAAIARQDIKMLGRARTWLEEQVEERERSELEKAKKALGGDNQQREPAGAGAQGELPY